MRSAATPAAARWLVPLAALIFAACSGGAPAAPRTTVLLAAEAPFTEAAMEASRELLAARGLTLESAGDGDEPDLVVTTSPPDAVGVPLVTRYWVAAVGLPHAADGLSMAELGDMVVGDLNDWAALTGEPLPLRLLVPVDPRPPFEQWWPDSADVTEPMPLADIPAALAADPGALALLPLDAVDARVRSLAVEGVNAVFGTGAIASYPLVERAWVVPREVDDGQFAQMLADVASEMAQRLALPPPAPILLRATGDIIPARCVYAKQRQYGDFRHAFLELGPWLAEADLAIGSLDASLSDAGAPFECVETFSLLAPAASVEGLAFAGFDVITVATNHVKDCGQGVCGNQAFFDTLANLQAAGIAPVGGGADIADARRPAVLTVRGVRFAFLGYDDIAPHYHAGAGSPGVAPLDESYLREDIAAAKQLADVVVVLPQWGVEYTADPTARQRALAAVAVEAGADLVIGNHPHWVQAAEAIDGAFVAYALGNFVFDQDWSIPTQQGVVLEAAFHGSQLKGVAYHPIHIVDQHQPVFATPAEAREILDRIWAASAALD